MTGERTLNHCLSIGAMSKKRKYDFFARLLPQYVKTRPCQSVFAIRRTAMTQFVLFFFAVAVKRGVQKIMQRFFPAGIDGVIAQVRGVFHCGSCLLIWILYILVINYYFNTLFFSRFCNYFCFQSVGKR